jgi:tetratricopeptide (TPR) repeat protein
VPWEELRETAVAHLDRADELQPGMPETYAGRSLLAQFNGDLETAVELAQEALEISPSYVDAMNWLQLTYRLLGRYQESANILREMLLVDPLSIPAHVNYIEMLSETGRCKEAHEQADLLIPINFEKGMGRHSAISFYCDGKLAASLAWNLKFELGGWIFALVGEYAEAHRKSHPHLLPFLLLMEGRVEEAIELADRRVRLDPRKYGSDVDTADLYYFARSFDRALTIYERAYAAAPIDRPISGNMPVIKTMRLAYLRRLFGDESGAQTLAAIAREENARQQAARVRDGYFYVAVASIAAFDNETERAIATLRTGVHDSNLRLKLFYDEPFFDVLRNDPEFVKLERELDDILAVEHEEILQLICFNNPAPNEWRPLPETCEGVVETGTARDH